MTKVLLVEDDPGVADLVIQELQALNFAVAHFKDGHLTWSQVLAENPDLIISDIMLPGKDGLTLVAEWRRVGCRVPILLLTAKNSVDDRVTGLEIGADDYLPKPFALTELTARVKALLRRFERQQPESHERVVGAIALNLHTREVTVNGETIALQNKEFDLLEFLMRFPGEIVSKRMIIEEVWHYNFNPGTNIVEVRIAALRQKIDKPYDTNLIETVRGVGYRFNV